MLDSLAIRLVCISAGSPYYNPHILRPALFPPSDGYEPPEDPLAGVARLIHVTSQIKALYPHMAIVGSGNGYLQEWLPNVAQYYVRTGQVDFVRLMNWKANCQSKAASNSEIDFCGNGRGGAPGGEGNI